MMTALLGSVGIGSVWGWLLVLLYGRDRRARPLLKLSWLTVSTMLTSLQLLWFTGPQGLLLFLGSTALFLCIHGGWRRHLADHPPLSSNQM